MLHVQVLQVVAVPANITAAARLSTSKASSSGSLKRKREDEAEEGSTTAEHSPNGRTQPASGGDVHLPEQARWGRAHAAELGEVIRWCAPRIAWDLLRLQLKVRGFLSQYPLPRVRIRIQLGLCRGHCGPIGEGL
jgi:hypothetical protein